MSSAERKIRPPRADFDAAKSAEHFQKGHLGVGQRPTVLLS